MESLDCFNFAKLKMEIKEVNENIFVNFPSCISVYILCIWEGSVCFRVWHISESGKEREKSNSQWVSSFRFATNCIWASFENMKFSYIPWCWQKRLSLSCSQPWQALLGHWKEDRMGVRSERPVLSTPLSAS